MKASETTLRNLLEGGKQFQIPLFQRPGYRSIFENFRINGDRFFISYR